MLRMVALESFIARATPRTSPEMSGRGPGFVQDDGGELAGSFERLAALYEYTHLRALAGPDHDGGQRSEAHRAGRAFSTRFAQAAQDIPVTGMSSLSNLCFCI